MTRFSDETGLDDHSGDDNGFEAAYQLSRWRTVLAILGASLGTFMAALDITIMGTAMPTIVSILGGLKIYSWAFTSFFLAAVVATPIFGKLADMYGIRLVFQVSMWVFIVASALCGTSSSMGQLIVFRGLQGAGGGSLIALGLTIVGTIYPPEKIGRMMGVMAAVWALAAVMGPIIGGVLVEKISWRWIFYINIPSGYHRRCPGGEDFLAMDLLHQHTIRISYCSARPRRPQEDASHSARQT
jgi:MFS family permease